MKSHLGVTEIARITSKERSTILRWIKSGKFGNVSKVGNEYQISHEQLSSWWDKNIKSTTGLE
jgi:excisionase family DNA binding protein